MEKVEYISQISVLVENSTDSSTSLDVDVIKENDNLTQLLKTVQKFKKVKF
jgi:hypothetical protein